MLDDLIVHCLEEIALEGELGESLSFNFKCCWNYHTSYSNRFCNTGCPLEKLWSFAQDFFDQKFKNKNDDPQNEIPSALKSLSVPEVPYCDEFFKQYYWLQFVNSPELVFFLVKDSDTDTVSINLSQL